MKQTIKSFSNLTNEKLPSTVNIPWRQQLSHEKVARENVQILEHVVFFKQAIMELNERIGSLGEDMKADTKKSDEAIDMLLNSANMQARIIESLETALESVLGQTMTMACNMVLSRRDTLLKSIQRISSEDFLALRNSPFTESELFPTNAINNVENNMLKRLPVSSSAAQPKRPRFDSQDFRTDRNERGSYRGRPSSRPRGNSSFRGRGQFRSRGYGYSRSGSSSYRK